MKTLVITLFCCLWSIVFITTAKAAEHIYLPIVTQDVPRETAQPEAMFEIDHIRLWSTAENGALATLEPCGQQHKVRVHVFDVHGDSGEQARLNGVIVQVIHHENGRLIEKFYTTGLLGSTAGVVEFELQQAAEVHIYTDVNGQLVSSQTAQVYNSLQFIPTQHLIASGHCQDENSCQALVNANQCAGHFSWNVVFKRRY